MKLKYILNSLIISIPLVLSSGCDDIDKTLLNSITKCSTNEEGKITKLAINNRDLTEEQVNKLLSYDLTDLSYTIKVKDGDDDVPEHPGYSQVPSAINNLKNLENLEIFFDSYLHPCAGDCELAGITTIKKDILKDLKNLKSLFIGGINVSQDNIDEISTMDNLETLKFYHSHLDSSLNYKSLGNLEKLNKLEVENVHDYYEGVDKGIYSINTPKDLIKSNKGIKELSMIIKPVSFDKDDLPNLEILKIRWSQGDFDSSFIEQLDKLTDLEFSYRGRGIGDDYNFSDVNADFSKLKNLKSLYFGSINMTEDLMNKIVNTPNLEKLTLGGNLILDEGYSEKLKNLKTLTALHLLGGYTKDMNDSIKALTNLNSLTIMYCNNEMKDGIPEFIYSMDKLEYLDLSDNGIKSVDEKLSNLENLKHLDLSKNSLINVPKQIENLKKLEYLNLKSNHIYADNPIFLNNFENLKYFYIEDNKNIKGKVLTNKNLIECNYSSSYSLCIPKDAKDIKCLNYALNFETCVDDDIKESTNGLCGPENGRCPYGQCCGKDGKCGSTEDSCSISKDCQMKYGSCNDECQEINEYLLKNKINEIICSVNAEGRATEIELHKFNLGENNCQKALDQLPNLHSLEKLTLDYYNHGKTDLSPLKKIEKLNELIINGYDYGDDDCELKEIPEIIFSLTNLKRLTVFDNKIGAIPDNISDLKNLEFLDVSFNDITKISPKIEELKNLKEFILSYNNNIKEIPSEFGNLKNLEVLKLTNCGNLSNYSDFIGKLENLKTLDLYYNNLSTIPKEIGNLSNLENIELTSNGIKELPDEFENLKNLKTLKLSLNDLTKFPEQIGKLEKLEKLELDFNDIDDEIPKSYNNLLNLTEINFSYNKNIKGETLTNKSLVVCIYDSYFMDDKEYTLCRHGNETCLNNVSIKAYKLCDNSSISTTTESESTTTSTPISTPSESTTTPTTISTTDKIVSFTNSTTTITTTTNSESATTTSVNPEPTNTEGRCGEGYGKCSSGFCCSKYGWCGKSNDHCDVSKGCKSEFGECTSTTTTSSGDVVTTTTTKSTEPTNIDGKCGEGFGNCPSGQCCSKYGWCGSSPDHCTVSNGCNPKYGICRESEISVNGRCGEGYGKCPSGQCCSKYGWCGTLPVYCDSGCQSEFGKCN